MFNLSPQGQRVNPEVARLADLFTDGAVTGDLLANVAAMNALPLYVEAAAPVPPSPVEIANRALLDAEASLRIITRAYVSARAEQARANTFPPKHHVRRNAFAMLNKRRREIAAAEARVIAARVALDCAAIASLPTLAA